MPHQNIIYLHLTHPFHSATSIHKPTSHIHQQSLQTDGKEPLEWCRRRHPLTPMVIFISWKATWWLSIFTFCLSPACTFWSLRKCKKRYEIEILKLLSKKWKLKSCIWISFFPFLHYFLSSSSQSRKEEWSQLWLVPTRNSKWAGWIINELGV